MCSHPLYRKPLPPTILEDSEIPKWLRVLYTFCYLYELTPITVRGILNSYAFISALERIGIKQNENTIRHHVRRLSDWNYLYRKELYPYGPKEYVISKKGVSRLHLEGLITERERDLMLTSIPLKLEGWK